MTQVKRPTLLNLCRRALDCKCPVCGKSNPFLGLLKMRTSCEICEFVFERESGYFLGSIYINYGVTSLVVVSVVLVLQFALEVESWIPFGLVFLFCTFFPIWFFRYSRLLFSAFDLFWDPPKENAIAPIPGWIAMRPCSNGPESTVLLRSVHSGRVLVVSERGAECFVEAVPGGFWPI